MIGLGPAEGEEIIWGEVVGDGGDEEDGGAEDWVSDGGGGGRRRDVAKQVDHASEFAGIKRVRGRGRGAGGCSRGGEGGDGKRLRKINRVNLKGEHLFSLFASKQSIILVVIEVASQVYIYIHFTFFVCV